MGARLDGPGDQAPCSRPRPQSAEPVNLDGFFKVKYQGARYSIGYPACPDLADRAKIARLLRPERIGVELSEEMQLDPEQSTDAIVIHHPAARYFSV